MEYHWHDLLGNVGVVLILSAYLLLQLEKMSAHSLKFSVLNGVGALLILISLTRDFNLSALIIESFWLAISLMGVIRYLLARRNPPRMD